MIQIFIQGFILGLAYLAPIGMQNMYVINSALTKKRYDMYVVVFTTIFFDISLSLASFFGMGYVMDKVPYLKMIILLAGSITIIIIGIQLLKSNPKIDNNITLENSFVKTALACFLVTWANPQALLDGTLLFGSLRASISPDFILIFITGACSASFICFFSLGTLINLFKKAFNNKILKVINIVCGFTIIYYGIKLGFNFYQNLSA